jgi:hypothetical protein
MAQRFAYPRSVRLVVALGLLVGCDRGPHVVIVDAAGDGVSPGCQYDCSALLQCRADVVYERAHAPIACELWQGSCPGRAHGCAASCDVSFTAMPGMENWSDAMHVFCAETPVAKVGDSCASRCLPTRAVADAQDNVTQQYLACDAALGVCVAAEPPAVAGYLGACVPSGEAWKTPGATGFAGAGDHACLVAFSPQTLDSKVAATIYCVGDWQCPQGSSCDDGLLNLDRPDIAHSVCRPGARGAPLVTHLP